MGLSKNYKTAIYLFLFSYALLIPFSRSASYIPHFALIAVSFHAALRAYSPCETAGRMKTLFVLLFAFSAWQSLTIVLNELPAAGMTGPFKKSLNFLPVFLLPLVPLDGKFRESSSRNSLYAILASSSAVIILGLFEMVSGAAYPIGRQPFREGKLMGFFGHHIDAGGFFSTLLAVVLCLLLFWRCGRRVKALLSFFVLALSLGVIFSMSRTYYVSLALTAPALFFLKGRRTALLLSSAAALLLASVLSLSPSVRDRALSIADIRENPSNVERLHLWRAALEMTEENPVAGTGYDSWREAMADYIKTYSGDWRFTDAASFHAHNLYLTVSAETGLVGLLLFLSFVFYLMFGLLKAGRGFKEGDFPRVLAMGVFFGLLNLLLGGMFEDNFGKLSNIHLIVFLTAAAFFSTNEGTKQR